MNDEKKYSWIKTTSTQVENDFSMFKGSRGENHLNKIWAQNSAFLSRYQEWVGIKYVLCSKVIKIILSLSSIRVFLCTHYVNDKIKYVQIKTTQKLLLIQNIIYYLIMLWLVKYWFKIVQFLPKNKEKRNT